MSLLSGKNDRFIYMLTILKKSLPTSLCQREGIPSLAKRGGGRFIRKIELISYPPCSCVQDDGNGFALSQRKSGFTLLEVLIATAILSVILASIYSTFFLSYRAMEGMDESLTKLQEARRAIDILRCELEATYQSEQDTNTFFRIEDRDVYGKQTTQLVFTTFSTLRPGLSKISYYVEEKEGKLSLFKRVESPYSKEESGGVDIIEDLDGFTIEAKYNDAWIRTWDTTVNKANPEELRIGLTMVVKGHTITLSDIAKPRIGNKG